MRNILIILASILIVLCLPGCGLAPNTPADGDAPAGGLAGDATRGEEIVKARGCLACHSTDGSKLIGPTFQGLYGAEVTLDDGDTVVVDDDYIRESIIEPSTRTAQGYPSGTMPAYNLDEAQIEDVVAYFESLK